jgi:glycosyltransferase involved in cell wall biosynthesis
MNVSVIIPVYKRLRFLDQAVASALGQSCGAVEVIVVDDGSPADPFPVIERFGSIVRLVRKPNGGQASARNAGIARAKGTYLLFLDEDDFLQPTAVADLLDAIAGHPGAVWAAGKFNYVDEHRNLIPKEHRCQYGSGEVYRQMIHNNLIGAPSAALVAADAVRQVGGFDQTPRYLFADDYDLWLSLARQFPLAATSRKVTNYRVHGAQTSREQTSRLNQAVLAVLHKHWAKSAPAFDPDFREAIAREHLSAGDECYVRGEMQQAREHWKKSTLGGQVQGPALWTRFAKSYMLAHSRRPKRADAA